MFTHSKKRNDTNRKKKRGNTHKHSFHNRKKVYSVDVYYLLVVVLKITKKNCTTHTGEERIDVFLNFF